MRLAAEPGHGSLSRLLSQLPGPTNGVPLALVLVLTVGAMVAIPYLWRGLGWITLPLYFAFLFWALMSAGASYAMRNGSITIGNHFCMRCHYRWADSTSERQMEIKRFRWEVESARRRGDKKALGMALSSLGSLLAMYGTDLREAQGYLEESLAIRRESGNPDVGHTLNNLAFVLYHLDRVGMARSYAEESVAMMRERNEWNGLSSALNTLAFILLSEGDTEQAKSAFREALVMKYKMSDLEAVAWNLEGMAGVAFAEEGDESAVRLFSAASTMRDEGHYYLLPQAKRDMEDKLASLRDRMGQINYADSWGAGRSMTPEQAVTYAMGEVGLADYLTSGVGGGRARSVRSQLYGGLGLVLAIGAGIGAAWLAGNIVGGGSSVETGSESVLRAATPASRIDGVSLYEFDVFADEFQFYLEDANPKGSSASPMFWDDEALERRLAVLGDIIAVGTARAVNVQVDIWVRTSVPEDNFEGWDHVVEGSMRLASGKLVVRGTTDMPEVYIPVKSGTYRVRVYMGALATADVNGGVEREDYYRIEVWLAPYGQPKVLKEWVGFR